MNEDLSGPEPAGRYHSLDALRAAMMLLGLVLHSAASYTQAPLGDAWPYQDPHTNPVFDLLVFFIHVFRMPVFFVAAGFFAALLYRRDGAIAFVRNRTKRVLVPLLVFWPTVVPVVGLSFLLALKRVGGSSDWADAIARQPLGRQPLLGHLWFLYDLLLLYFAALVSLPLVTRLPAGVRHRMTSLFRAHATSALGAVVLAALSTITLVPMEVPGIETSAALLPPIRVIAAYGMFFAFGWLLFGCRDLLPSFGRRWKSWLASGMCATAAYLYVVIARPIADRTLWHLASVGLASIAIWLLVFGIVGLFVRHMDAPRPLVRYFSDASYWIYLVHLAPVVWGVGLLARATAPAIVKFGLVLGFTTVVTTITYHYLVRSTAIGALLNGRRYARSSVAGSRCSTMGSKF